MMDTKARFDQLEEIIVELLRKHDLTMEELAFLRLSVSEVSVVLVRMHSDLVRMDGEAATTRRLQKDSVRLLNSMQSEFAASVKRHDRLFEQTAELLAEQKVEMNGLSRKLDDFQVETRAAFAQNTEFQNETRAAFAQNTEFQNETRAAFAQNTEFQNETRAALAKLLEFISK